MEGITTFLEKINLPKLSETQISLLNFPFTASEVRKVVASLPNDKSPGPDGLPNEYYTIFSAELTPHLTNVLATGAQTSSFPPEMPKAYVVTLPKFGKYLQFQAHFTLKYRYQSVCQITSTLPTK